MHSTAIIIALDSHILWLSIIFILNLPQMTFCICCWIFQMNHDLHFSNHQITIIFYSMCSLDRDNRKIEFSFWEEKNSINSIQWNRYRYKCTKKHFKWHSMVEWHNFESKDFKNCERRNEHEFILIDWFSLR